MKQAKKFIGRKIRRTYDLSEINMNNQVDEFNIIQDFEKFKTSMKKEDNTQYKFELLQDNLTLYKCDVRKTNNVANLKEIRDLWHRGVYDYSKFYTKEEIEKMLNEDYLVAVQGLQEIDKEDLEKLD